MSHVKIDPETNLQLAFEAVLDAEHVLRPFWGSQAYDDWKERNAEILIQAHEWENKNEQ